MIGIRGKIYKLVNGIKRLKYGFYYEYNKNEFKVELL